jgi:hypothetical protein
MESTHQPLPKARADGLVVQELMDEVVVYDLARHRSHCLNQTAALILRHCDGSTSVAEMARRLQQEAGVPVDEEAVWLGLSRLSRAHLLQEKVHAPVSGDRATRRTILRRLAAVGGVALVSSISVAEAATGTIPAICFTTCCGLCQSGSLGNNCKCCLPATGTAFCSGNCGAGGCGSAQCLAMPNCCNPGQPPC